MYSPNIEEEMCENFSVREEEIIKVTMTDMLTKSIEKMSEVDIFFFGLETKFHLKLNL